MKFKCFKSNEYLNNSLKVILKAILLEYLYQQTIRAPIWDGKNVGFSQSWK